MVKLSIFLFSLMFFSFLQIAKADEFSTFEQSNLPIISAVQKRPNQLTNELGFHASFLPMDHFNTYYAVGGAFTHWFNDYMAWEVLNLNYAKNSPTGLNDYLVGTYGANPETFDIIQYYGTTNFIYSPLYMKHLFKTKEIMWGDLSLVGGAGLAKLETLGNINTFDFGGMVRFFSGSNWVSKLDIRQYLFSSAAVKPNMAITFSISYNFGKTEEKVQVQEDEE